MLGKKWMKSSFLDVYLNTSTETLQAAVQVFKAYFLQQKYYILVEYFSLSTAFYNFNK